MGAKEKSTVTGVIAVFKKTYPDAECALTYSNAYELLVATVLSAQCTDKRVNMVTPAVFRKYPDPKALSLAKIEDVETLVRSTGFYKNKAKSLVGAAQAIIENHQGEVPAVLDELVKLPGVGRKTANVVLGNVFNIPGLVVDTHVGRLCRRLGFTRQNNPEKIEQEMMLLVPKKDWTLFSHLLISHGRSRCFARKPDCENCEAAELCPKIGVKT